MQGNKHPVLRRMAAARSERDRWQGDLAAAYKFALPGSVLFSGDGKGPPVAPDVFDATARDAIEEWAARMAYAIGLGFQKLVSLEPGEKLEEAVSQGAEQGMGDPRELLAQAKKVLEKTRDTIDGHLQRSNFLTEALSALRMAAVSTGVLLVHGQDQQQPVRFEAVPLDQILFTEGPTGRIENVYREGRHSLSDAARLWPEATFSAQAKERAEKASKAGTPEALDFVEATEWDPENDQWKLVILEAETGHLCLEATLAESPWIVFRVDKFPGQTHGAGAALQKLPDIKTLNKTVELTLQNAAIAITGMWQADDDGVLQPEKVVLRPGVVIPKAWGSAGLQPLNTGGNFDVSQLILADLRQGITRAITGPALPGAEQGVRTATEWTVREQQMVILMAPHYTRLYRELVVPLYRVVSSMLAQAGLLGDLDLIGGTVRVTPVSPYSDMAKRTEMANRMQGLQAAAAVSAQDAQVVIDGEKAVEEILSIYGWPKAVTCSPEKSAV